MCSMHIFVDVSRFLRLVSVIRLVEVSHVGNILDTTMWKIMLSLLGYAKWHFSESTVYLMVVWVGHSKMQMLLVDHHNPTKEGVTNLQIKHQRMPLRVLKPTSVHSPITSHITHVKTIRTDSFFHLSLAFWWCTVCIKRNAQKTTHRQYQSGSTVECLMNLSISHSECKIHTYIHTRTLLMLMFSHSTSTLTH